MQKKKKKKKKKKKFKRAWSTNDKKKNPKQFNILMKSYILTWYIFKTNNNKLEKELFVVSAMTKPKHYMLYCKIVCF